VTKDPELIEPTGHRSRAPLEASLDARIAEASNLTSSLHAESGNSLDLGPDRLYPVQDLGKQVTRYYIVFAMPVHQALDDLL